MATDLAEVNVDEALVHRLLTAQHPDVADRPLARAAAGWDNVMFRLGDDLAVRLPTRAIAAPLIRNEQRWLPELAPHLPLATPVPLRIGAPGEGYPWHWSVTPWIAGRTALDDPPSDLGRTARQLGAFLRALHRPAPADAPPNPYRGGPLASRSASVAEWLTTVGERVPGTDADDVRACWDDHVALPRWTGPPLWVHGDVHPLNLIVRDGALVAVIDFGDLTAGDPATDLTIAWSLLPAEHRPTLRASSGVDDATWRRGRGWALCLGLAMATNASAANQLQAVGRAMVAAVLRDAADDGH